MIRPCCSALLFASLLVPAATAAAAVPAEVAPTLAEQYLLSAANQERAALGLPPVRRDARLAAAALDHARAMAAHAAISHQFAGERELASRAASAGVRFSVVEENVGEAPTAIRIHELWMRSPHHRDNLLDPSVDAAGISVVARNGELYAVEDFAKTVRQATFEQQEAAIARLITQRGLNLLTNQQAISDARQTCNLSTGFIGRKPWFVMRFTSDSLDRLPGELTAKLASGRYRSAAVGACPAPDSGSFSAYNLAVLLYP